MNVDLDRVTPELLHGLTAAPIPTPAQQDHLEVRLYAMYATLSFGIDTYGLISYVSTMSSSLLYRVAGMAHGRNLIATGFAIALVLILPHAWYLVFKPTKLGERWPRKLATASAALVALIWAYLAVLALPLDVEASPVSQYLMQMGVSLALASVYAVSLNAQLLRRLHKAMNP